MWTIKTSGTSRCNDEDDDVYDETKGRRIAVSRAKEKAYAHAATTVGVIVSSFKEIYKELFYFVSEMIDFHDNESNAIINVIETGKSTID